MFDGEEWQIKDGKSFEYHNDQQPKAALIWEGSGTVNFRTISKNMEFLITPNATLKIISDKMLTIYVFYPMLK